MDRLWYLITILAALLIALALGMWAFDTANDFATAIAPVVTALATIGAAVFGVSVGREAGKSEGQNEGVKAGRKQMASEVLPHVSALTQEQPIVDRSGGAPSGPLADVGREAGSSRNMSALEQQLRQIIES